MEKTIEESAFRRPIFLAVLCILVFIGYGWNILVDLFYLFTANVENGTIGIESGLSVAGEPESQKIDLFFSDFWNSSLGLMQAGMLYAREMVIVRLILSVIAFSGAVIMFQLRRWGFYLYAAALILSLFVLPYFAGFNFVVILKMLLAGIVSFLFIALFAFHLKYMNR